MHVRGFPSVVDARTRVLVLGTMPGVPSLEAQQYYAHPRNLFWRLMGELLGVDPAAPYEQRLAQLLARGVGLWDVLAACERPGSLDAAIAPASMAVNDIGALLAAHPSIGTVCCNGAAAARAFRRHVLPQLPGELALAVHALPSTSPANAAIPYDRKREAWRVVGEAGVPDGRREGGGRR